MLPIAAFNSLFKSDICLATADGSITPSAGAKQIGEFERVEILFKFMRGGRCLWEQVMLPHIGANLTLHLFLF